MIKLFFNRGILCVLFLGIGSFFQADIKAQENRTVSIIPYPAEVKVLSGSYKLKESAVLETIGFSSNNLLSFSKSLLESAGAKTVVFRNGNKKKNGSLLLAIDKKMDLPTGGYKLSVNQTGISITAATEQGIFYGIQTLIQLFDHNLHAFPFVEIKDYPRYSYRGLHLDVSRHFFPVNFIKEYIDILSFYKLNTFHWHLTDDQGWRIEIKKYPKLTEIGAFRAQTVVGHSRIPPLRYDGIKYGGYYTQKEIKEVVAYAASRYVTVIPEIEMPGHSMAALAAYPYLGCGDNPGPFKTHETWGVIKDVYCAGKEETFNFLTDVLDEVIPLFPSRYIHIGGDECPKDRWKVCEHCQKRIKDENLKDENDLQSYFITRIEKHLNAKGKYIIGWDEILDGGIAPNATVMSWRGTKGGIAAAKEKHDVIMTPHTHLYFDHKERKGGEETVLQGGFLPLEKVYSYDPTPTELTAEEQKYIIGVQANLWAEYTKTPEKVWYMLFPRVYALSEIAWTPLANKNWTDFSENRVPEHLAIRDRQGKRYNVPEPIGLKEGTVTGEKFLFSLKEPVKGAKIYYTIDGFTPHDFDNEYQSPFNVWVPKGEERKLKAVTISPSGKRSTVVTTVLKNSE